MNTKNLSAGERDADYAFSVLKNMDDYKNLHRSAPVFVFAASGAIGVITLFLTLDLTIWLGLNVVEPWMQISMPYALCFVVWIFSFLLIQSALHYLGVRDLSSIAKDRLSSLHLSIDELDQLRHDVEAKELKHKNIFEDVIRNIEDCNMRT